MTATILLPGGSATVDVGDVVRTTRPVAFRVRIDAGGPGTYTVRLTDVLDHEVPDVSRDVSYTSPGAESTAVVAAGLAAALLEDSTLVGVMVDGDDVYAMRARDLHRGLTVVDVAGALTVTTSQTLDVGRYLGTLEIRRVRSFGGRPSGGGPGPVQLHTLEVRHAFAGRIATPQAPAADVPLHVPDDPFVSVDARDVRFVETAAGVAVDPFLSVDRSAL